MQNKTVTVMVILALMIAGAAANKSNSQQSEIRKNLQQKWDQLKSAHEDRMAAFDSVSLQEKE